MLNIIFLTPSVTITDTNPDNNIVIDNTIYSYTLNNLLIENGYIDTNNSLFNEDYLNVLSVNARIEKVNIKIVHRTTSMQNNNVPSNGKIAFDVTINWEILDFYEKPIYNQTTNSTSDDFAVLDFHNCKTSTFKGVKSAIENGFIHFINSEKVNFLLYDKSEIQVEDSIELITIPVSKVYASNLPQAIKSSVTVKTSEGHGSGFFISENGYILTNYHVVSDTTEIKIVLDNGEIYKPEIIRLSKIHDLALLKIEIDSLIPIKLNHNENIQIASEVYAVGTPTSERLSQSISQGIISALRKRKNGNTLIQTDASVNGGNSGGALVIKEGIAIGIVTSKLEGIGIEGVAFAIPTNEIFDKLNIIIK